MELKDFISQTIVDVVKGIEDAQNELPHNYFAKELKDGETYTANDERIEISFDLCVGNTQSAGSKAGLTVLFAAIGGGTQSELKEESHLMNKVSFKIPVKVPIVSGDSVKTPLPSRITR